MSEHPSAETNGQSKNHGPRDDVTGQNGDLAHQNGAVHGDAHSDVAEQNGVDRLSQPVDEEGAPRLPFAVVGVGASAGGLEAYTEFLKAARADSGMAFVLIQHLSPKHESVMAELLGKQTAMPVLQVEDGMEVAPNHVYVIRPGYTMTIKDGRLHLGESAAERGHRRPIDDFFKSLADEQRERAIAVILSGTGSNGTAGAEAVKAVGGMCIAQDPDTAKFPQMPRSLIDTGLADAVLKAGEVFDAALAFASHPYAAGEEKSPAEVARAERLALAEVMAVLRTRVRHDFSGYKKPTIVRRIQRRMSLLQLSRMNDYVRTLRQTPAEVHALADDLMIHVTGFFRDESVWESLRTRVIVPMVQERANESSIRVWVTACSSGEEAYTIGMLLIEAAEEAGKSFDIKIFATDTAERSLAQARAGIFPGGIESEVTPERLDRFFERDDAFYRVKKDLRELVVFAPQNVLQDPPFSRLDICTCRNLLIYIEGDVQRRVLQMLHFGLREGGTLLLGNSETINGAEDLFEPIDKKARLYRRVGPTRHGTIDFPVSHRLRPPASGSNGGGDFENGNRQLPRATVAQMTNRLLLDQFTPAAVVVDRQGRIVYYHGRTERFLEQPRGEPTRDLMVLAREEIRGALRNALNRAFAATEPVHVQDGKLGKGNDRTRVSFTVTPLDPKVSAVHFLVSFEERPDPTPVEAPGAPATGEMAEDLRRVREELQSTIEELQTSNEEMKASHEEVTSVNEELQSSNEELETSKEELQSLNEELTTVNAQLHAKMEELERTTNDLASLLSSTDIAVVFLDTEFRIRRFTPAVRDLLELIPADIGRPMTDLARKFSDPDLTADARQVLERLMPVEREVVSDSGRWYVRRVLPYRTADNRIDGVVITFLDVTEQKRAVDALRHSEERYRLLVSSAAVGICETDRSEKFTYVNDRFCEIVHRRREELLGGMTAGELIYPDDRPVATAHLDRLFETGEPFVLEKRFSRPTGGPVWVLSYDSARRDAQGAVVSAVAVAVDDSERQAAQVARQVAEERLRQSAEASGVGDWELTLPERSLYYSDRSFELIGLPPTEGFNWDLHEQRIVADDRAGVRAAFERAVDPRGTGQYEAEFRVARPGGGRAWMESRGRTEFEGDGNARRPTLLRGTMRDVTARKQAEIEHATALQREQAARAEAEAANNTKDQFLANASHELRTPLSAILLWSSLLHAGDSDADTLKEGLAAIEHSAKSQQKLIEDLMDSARINAGRISLELKPTDLTPVLRAAVDTLRPAAGVKGIQVEVDVGADVGRVMADAERLQQVIWNLVSNAVKFTPSGGRVDVGLWRRGEAVEIRVSDTGAGIEADLVGAIFGRFRQADPSATRRYGGLGLGLAISRQLVELHGGTINVSSGGTGKGSTFVVVLPLPAKPRGRAAAQPPRGETVSLEGVRVLLVEDDVKTREALAMVLRKAKAEVETVGHVDDALAALARRRPDVLVSDIGLPDRDGHSLIRDVRAAETGDARLPAVALSAFDRPQDHTQAAESGFDLYLSKPVDPRRLLAQLQGLVSPKV